MLQRLSFILILFATLTACEEENNFSPRAEQWELTAYSGRSVSSCFGFLDDESAPEPKKNLIFSQLLGLDDQAYERTLVRLDGSNQFQIVKRNQVVMTGSMQQFGDSIVWQRGDECLRFKILFQSPDSLKLHTAGDSSNLYDVTLTFVPAKLSR